SLTQAFKDSPLFSPREKELLEIGESSSRVVETLDRIQENTKLEQEEQTKRSVTILEPLVIVAIGGLVLFFVLVFILPLLTMEQSF
ncbi:MAG: type II secretion system F family protein, partial [Spirochaetia bacterium]|nr:type II secretion system F family protein [Spirochaetia bacterium]